jgi:hypothetical protein
MGFFQKWSRKLLPSHIATNVLKQNTSFFRNVYIPPPPPPEHQSDRSQEPIILSKDWSKLLKHFRNKHFLLLHKVQAGFWGPTEPNKEGVP